MFSLFVFTELLDYSQVKTFLGNETASDHFRILYIEGDTMLVGAR